MPRLSLVPLRRWAILWLAAFLVLAASIVSRPARSLMDFDQPFYITIAYDLDRYGVFSNGIFSGVDNAVEPPAAGMFFGPVYPVLVLAAMKIDHRFAAAVHCNVEADRAHRDPAPCEPYAAPMRIIHAFLLALGVLAIAAAGERMFRSKAVFWLAGALATLGLAAESDIFSFIMTESIAFSLYSVLALTLVLAWTTARSRHFMLAGGLLGVLCLTRPSFLVLLPVVAGLCLLHGYRLSDPRRAFTAARVLGLTLAFAAVVGAWGARNAVAVGKFRLTEEYGSAALIERFAYDDMTAREFIQAFPYCVPGIGDLGFDLVYGTDSMHRFVFHTPGSFFHAGRDRRDALEEEHGRLDPLIGGIVRDEMRARWWRYLLVGIPLAWCGMWAGWLVSLVLIPLFAGACVRAVRRSEPLLLMYAAPAIAMLGLHAAVANQTTRYNLILIGPFSVGAAWIICSWGRGVFGSRAACCALRSAPMRGLLSKVGGWWSRHVTAPDRDYGTAPMRGDVSTAQPESAEAALEESIVKRVDQVDTLTEVVQAIAECVEKPGEAGAVIEQSAIDHQFGTLGTVIYDHQHDRHLIPSNLGSGALGFFRSVVIQVLARLLATSMAQDGNTANRTGPAPERDQQSGK